MTGIVLALVTLVADTSSDSNPGVFGLIFLLSGFAFYGFVYLKYRNVNQRHHYETETRAEKLNMVQRDDMVESMKNLSNARMRGANNTSVEGSGAGLGGLKLSMSSILEQVQTATGGKVTMSRPTVSTTPSGTAPQAPPPAAPATPPPPSAPPAGPPPTGAPGAPPPPAPPTGGPGQAF